MSPTKEATSRPSVSLTQFPPLVKTLGEFFASQGVSAYLVGGVVRDALLGRQTWDVDLAVDGETGDLGAGLARLLGGRSILLDEARGIVRVVVSREGWAETIDLTSAPDGIAADLSRRDFTLDAMAVPLSKPWVEMERIEVVDPYGGAEAARSGVIRAISASAFEDDPARLLRGPRLAAQLRFALAEETAELIRSQAHLVTQVAPERVREEMLKLLAEPSASLSLRLLDDLGLLCLVIPELEEARGVAQPPEHHWDVLEHCIETAGQVETLFGSQEASGADGLVHEFLPPFEDAEAYFSEEVSDGHSRMTLLKLAGLLHDVAKPATKTVESSGRMRFLGHHHQGSEMAVETLSRLRLSRRGVELVGRMVEHHLRPRQMAQKGELPSQRAVYRYYRDLGDAAVDTLYLNMADYLAARGPLLGREEWAEHCRIVGHILRGGSAQTPPEGPHRLIDGRDIMQAFSMEPGPRIGTLLEVVREAQASGEITSKEEALELVKSKLSAGGEVA